MTYPHLSDWSSDPVSIAKPSSPFTIVPTTGNNGQSNSDAWTKVVTEIKDQDQDNTSPLWLSFISRLILGLLVGGVPFAAVLTLWLTSSTIIKTTTTTTAATITMCSNFLTFDTLTNQTTAPIPNGYGGLNWGRTYVINGLGYTNGYRTGVVSSPYTTFNFGAVPGILTPNVTGSKFTFCSFYSAAAWQNQTNLTMVGSRGGVQIIPPVYYSLRSM